MTRRAKRLIVLSDFVGVLAIAFVTRAGWLPGVGRWLDVGEPPRRVDYAVLLSGEPQTRPVTMALLYKHGYVGKIVLTRPLRHPHTLVSGLEYPQFAKKVFAHYGVPESELEVCDGEVMSTYDEANVVAQMIRARPQASFAIVTSDYHTRRGLWVFRRTVPEAAERMHAFSSPTDDFSAADWWQTEFGLTTYLREYLRLGFYYFRYGTAMYWTIAILVVAMGLLMRDRLARLLGQHAADDRA